ncbi:MAG: tripartite tricarboxylate transporter substrate-binding protein, partial [Burkholderiaceae bacterium]
TGKARSAFLPQLPTVAEAGVPGYVFDSWIGVLAPAATPPAEVERLNAAINKVMADPAIQERFKRLGVEPRSTSAAAFAQLLRADWETMAVVVKSSGARIE